VTDRIDRYRHANAPLPEVYRFWPLFGAGFDHLGDDGRPAERRLPEVGPDEVLVRHDAVGLCYSDVKVIQQGQAHPRIYRDMQTRPVVLGHEVSLTVVKAGEHWRSVYHPGERFIVQSDIYVDRIGFAYGYEIQGGLSQYNVLDRRVLAGDHGSYLIPVQPGTGYAASALTEPWACVNAAYQLQYRSGLKAGGVTWIIGTQQARDRHFTIGAGFDRDAHPARLLLTDVPPALEADLKARAVDLTVEVMDVGDINNPQDALVDDIVVLGADADRFETAGAHLGPFGTLAIVADMPLPRRIQIDAGRIHYDRWQVVGSTGTDIGRACSDVPTRSALKAGGRAWFVGAGGPMGRMHVQRALQLARPPGTILCTDVSDDRLEDLCGSFAAEARARGIDWICLNPVRRDEYLHGLEAFRDPGFDDIVVLAPIPAAIGAAADYLAPGGVMNIFAGLNRGTLVSLDLSGAYLKGTRIIGHSGLTIEDLRSTLRQVESGELSPNRSVAAVGSLSAAREGLLAVREGRFPGKVVIYPQIKDFPLTALPDLKDTLPGVWAKLDRGQEWTEEAENEFLRQMLP